MYARFNQLFTSCQQDLIRPRFKAEDLRILGFAYGKSDFTIFPKMCRCADRCGGKGDGLPRRPAGSSQ